MNKQLGLALVLVLWILALLSIMAGSFALSMRRETAIIIGLKNNAEGRAIAEAGIALAELMMLNNDPDRRWRADGRIYEVEYGDARIRLRLLSETGKIDINTVDETKLQEVMQHSETDDLKQRQIVDAIMDWRDEDDLVRINGAEKQEYLEAGLRYGPGNRPFQSLAEVQMVLGMDETVYNWLEPLITVYSKQQVDVRKASREVLEVLDLDVSAESNEESSEDQSSLQDDTLGTMARQDEQQPVSLSANEAVTIISEAMIAPDMTTTLKAVVKRSPGVTQPFQILDWQTDVASQSSLFSAAMDALLDTDYAESRLDN